MMNSNRWNALCVAVLSASVLVFLQNPAPVLRRSVSCSELVVELLVILVFSRQWSISGKTWRFPCVFAAQKELAGHTHQESLEGWLLHHKGTAERTLNLKVYSPRSGDQTSLGAQCFCVRRHVPVVLLF